MGMAGLDFSKPNIDKSFRDPNTGEQIGSNKYDDHTRPELKDGFYINVEGVKEL